MRSERLARFLGVILFVVFLPGLTLVQAPGEVPQRSVRGPDIVLKLELSSYEIVRDEEGFDVIRAEGFSLSGMPGDPWLPRKVYNVAVPPDAALGSLSLEVVDAQVVKLPGAYQLRLATPDLPAIEGDTAGYHSGYTPASDATPTGFVKLLPPGQKRKYRFARLEFTPFQYDAASGELSLVSELTVRINYDVSLAAKDEVLLGDRVMEDVARQLLVNYETAQAWYQVTSGQDEPGDVYDYVIITTNAIETGSSKLADFIAHKQSLGYSVLTITEDEYGGLVGQSPNGTAEKIRKWLQDNYVIYSIEYVLLIGDPDPDDPSSGSDSVGDVPMKMCWPIRNDPTHGTRPSPTDYFFADLTGNWNLDGDLYFGEWADYTGSGGVDFANEVYVGRIPVYSGAYSTLDDILQKIIDYENEANPEVWRESALLPMSFSTETYDGAPLAEQMKDDYLTAAGFSSWTQYQQGSGACSLDSTYASDEELRGGTVVRDRWAANDYGLVLWWGHGSQTGASVGCDGCWDGTLFNNTQTSSLDDDHPSHVYQNSCTNGYPENTNNLQYALLKQGAVSTVGATRVSWFNTLVGYGDFDGSTTNSGIGYEYAQRLVGGQAAGDALYNAKASMSPEFNTRLMNFYDFNLYGDPSTGLPAATTPSTHSISGYVRNSSGSGISGVTADFGGARPAVTTNSSGYYTQTAFSNGNYIVTFSLSGYAFSPVEDQVTVSGADVTHDATGYPFTPTSLPFSDGFESGGLGNAWAVETDYEGRVRVDSTYPHVGSYSLLLDDDTDDGFTSHASAILALDLSGQSQVEMSFWWREFGDENDADDGVFISDDYGATWYQAFSFNDGPSTFTQATIDLDAQASAAGMSLNDHFLVKFQFYDDYSITTDGYAIDEVGVQVPCVPDIEVSPTSFEETVLQGEMVTKTLTINNAGTASLTFHIREVAGGYTSAGGALVIGVPPVEPVAVGEAALHQVEGQEPDRAYRYTIEGQRLWAGGDITVLLVYADNAPDQLKAFLEGYPDIGTVDTWYAGSPGSGSIPALSDLLPYDVVIAWNNRAWDDPDLIGDVLADYHDAGGNVILTVDAWSAGTFRTGGRFIDEEYTPFLSLGGAVFNDVTLGWYNASHPLMEGVSTSAAHFHNQVELSTAAVPVAEWNDGMPLVATKTKGGHEAVGVNTYYGDGDVSWTTDAPPIIHNAIVYLSWEDVPWLSEEPITGTVSGGGSLPVDVIFDATGLALGDYTADLIIYNNDPDENPVTVPVVMHVTDNNPPNTPSNPSPADGATDQDINVDLSWTGGDPDAGDTVTYDVYFEADDSTPDNLICNDVSTPACDPGTLDYGTHYYWYVVATDSHAASTTGDTWDFTTAPAPAPPAIISITANSGDNNKVVHITNLAGNDFQSGATVRLIKTGQADIVATNVVASASQITCDFDLMGAYPGKWTVRVTNPDTQYAELYNGFTVNGLVFLPTVLRNH